MPGCLEWIPVSRQENQAHADFERESGNSQFPLQGCNVSRYARRVDSNHAKIARGLIAIGCLVHDTSAAGGGFPDLVVGFRGRIFLIEIKDGDKPPSARQLTTDQAHFHKRWRGLVHVVTSLDEAIKVVTQR